MNETKQSKSYLYFQVELPFDTYIASQNYVPLFLCFRNALHLNRLPPCQSALLISNIIYVIIHHMLSVFEQIVIIIWQFT